MSPSASPAQLAVAITPARAATGVRLDQPVQVVVRHGRIARVTVTGADGGGIEGTLDTTGSSWQSTDPLAGGTAYTVSATVVDEAGRSSVTTSTFRTLTPDASYLAHLQPSTGDVVGVGMPVVVTFNHGVTHRDAVEKAIRVTTTPAGVEGAWHWFGSTQMQWRPKVYWPAGTTVSVRADLAGVELAPGVWGRNSASTFRIGAATIDTVDVRKHTLTVTTNGTVVRVIPITTGAPATPTRNGIKVIMSKERKVRMDAATTGIDPKDPNYYNLLVDYAMRLTWSGEYLHAAPWSVWAQGRQNVSHGCTGMSLADAAWLYQHSKIGDVVVYTGSARPLEWGNGYTAWNLSYDRWAA